MRWSVRWKHVMAAALACVLALTVMTTRAYAEAEKPQPDMADDILTLEEEPVAGEDPALTEDFAPTDEVAPAQDPTPSEESSLAEDAQMQALDESASIDIMNCDVEDMPVVRWDGEPVTPKPVVSYEGRRLVEGVDYTLDYRNNNQEDVTAYVIICGTGDFWGEYEVPFRIPKRDIWECDVSAIPAQRWTGAVLRPKPVVSYMGRVLKEGVDYTVSWDDAHNNPDFSFGYVVLKGIGDFASDNADRFVEFEIVDAKYIWAAEIVYPEAQKWTGKPVTPKVKVIYEGETLKEGRDYELSYRNNVDTGDDAIFIVKGKGEYWDETEGSFSIVGTRLGFENVSDVPPQKWTGKAVQPKPKVTYKGETLKEGVDYTLSYTDNVRPCVKGFRNGDYQPAYAIVQGKGRFTCNLYIGFTIARSDGAWKKTNGKWWYRYPDGSYPRATEQCIDGKYYYFDNSGYMVTGWIKLGGDTCYFKPSGEKALGWVKYEGQWYYLDETEGFMYRGLFKAGGKVYLADSSGAMLTGWQKYGGGWYYLQSSGAAASGWKQIGGAWYWFDASHNCRMVTGWKQISGKWYYFASSGSMVTGWKQIGGKWYYFESSGAMAVSKWVGNYYLQADGTMATNKWIGNYHVDANGKWDMSR